MDQIVDGSDNGLSADQLPSQCQFDAIVYITYQPVLSNLWQKSIDHLPKSYSGARTAGTDPCYDFILVDG